MRSQWQCNAMCCNVVLCCAMLILQNAINFYAQSVLSDAGFSANDSATNSIYIGVVKVVMICVTIRLMDSKGRKTLLLIGILGMSVCGMAVVKRTISCVGRGQVCFTLLTIPR